MKFTEFGFDPRILEGIEAMGFEEATPVQEQVMPAIMEGYDLLASAQTGTGKTAAFLLPILHNIITSPHEEGTKALIIVPTRELAIQIEQQLDGFSYFLPVSSSSVYGGGSGELFVREQNALSNGSDIVICTTGRMMSHLNMDNADLSKLKYLILDEADRMLDMGFHDDIMKIISYMPKKRQNLMFSATMPPKIRTLAMKILSQPKEIIISNTKPPERIKQEAYVVYENQKLPLIKHILNDKQLRSILIFCSTKGNVKLLSRELKHARYNIEEMHSDLEQEKRGEVMARFKNRSLNILVATDIVSRGIDIEDIDLVINYDVPHDGEDYVHRIGRTARAASDGEAITFISDRERHKFQRIEALIGITVAKANMPEFLGAGPSYDAPHFKKDGHKGHYNDNKRKLRPKRRFKSSKNATPNIG